MASAYASAASRKALALVVSEASVSRSVAEPTDGGRREAFEAIERSASEALLDIFTRYMRAIGTASQEAAQHAGRAESNLADVLVGIGAVGGGAPRDLLTFLEEEASEAAFPCNVAAFPVARLPATTPPAPAAGLASKLEETRPGHVPDFLPPLPDKRTYSRTVTHNVRPSDGPAAKKRRSAHKRQAQDSLLAFTEATTAGAACSAAADPLDRASMAPPPLPALPDDEYHGPTASTNAFDAAAGTLRGVPDVLASGIPAVLQSSANLECSGLVAPAVHALIGDLPSGEPSGAAAAVTANPRQSAILGLKHLHGLDEIGKDTGGDADDL